MRAGPPLQLRCVQVGHEAPPIESTLCLVVAKADVDLLAFKLHLMGLGGLGGGHREGGARSDIELGPMPWTGDRALLWVERPFAKWAAVVSADIIQGVEMSGRVNQHDKPVLDLNQHFAGVRNLGQLRDWNEIAHIA
jgi:hypothetical protein